MFMMTHYLGAFAAAALSLSSPVLAQMKPKPQMQADPGDFISYKVKKGDTLIGFSQRFLLKTSDYSKVALANGKRNADRLRPGEELKIPVDLLKSKPIEARILAFTGTVSVKGSQGSRAAVVGMPLNEGQTIETGDNGFLSLSLSTGARLSMPSRSTVRILRLRRYDLTGGADLDFAVDKGRTETSATPFRDTVSRFRMRTPVAVSAVRGTTFRIGYNGEQTPSLTEVVEGSVGVASTVTGKTSAVPGGFGVAATRSGDLSQEKLLPPPALIAPGKVQQDADVRFSVSPNPLATGYNIQLSRDAGFVDIFAAKQSSDASITFEGVSDGVYFVRAMAIAKSGLEGLTEAFAFKRQMTTLSAARSAERPDEFLFSWAGQGTAKQLYRFQLVKGEGNDIPVVDEPGLQSSSITLVSLKPAVYQWRVGVRSFPDTGDGIIWTPFQKLTISE